MVHFTDVELYRSDQVNCMTVRWQRVVRALILNSRTVPTKIVDIAVKCEVFSGQCSAVESSGHGVESAATECPVRRCSKIYCADQISDIANGNENVRVI